MVLLELRVEMKVVLTSPGCPLGASGGLPDFPPIPPTFMEKISKATLKSFFDAFIDNLNTTLSLAVKYFFTHFREK